MPFSKTANSCVQDEASISDVSENGRLLLWWPWKVTATSRRHLNRDPGNDVDAKTLPLVHSQPLLRNLPQSSVSPHGEAGVSDWLSGMCLLMLCCLMWSSSTVAQESEQSGWELSIANGLLLFKREKTVQSREAAEILPEIGGDAEFAVDTDGFEEPDIVEESWFMPAVESHFSSDVSGIIARSTVIQTFKNPTDEWLHGTYQFPLPEDAAVDVLKMRIGQREIIGEIQRKQEARKRFAQAKRSGRRASLVEQQKPNMFTTNLANIAPGEEIEIEIQFQQKARYLDGEFRLRFPTTYIPRAMIPGMEPENDVPDFGSDSIFNSQFSAQISLNAGSELAFVKSPHYQLVTEVSSQFTYNMRLDTPQPGVRDLELSWQYRDSAPQVLHYRQAGEDGEYGLVMVLPGDAKQAPATAREITFVIDTSSSMAGESIRQARAALALAVQSLKPDDRFNIIEFNSDAFAFWDAPQLANTLNKNRALNFIQNLQARGGTDIFAALQLSLELQANNDRSWSLLQQLVFVTDGAIGYEEQLLAEIESQLGDARLFTVGIGAAPNSYFMVEAANVGRGSYTHISNTAQVNSRMSELLLQLSSPSLTDIHLDFGMEVEMYPNKIPDLYHGEPLVLSYVAPQAVSALQVQGRRAGEIWQQSLELGYWQEHEGIAKYWANDKIRDLGRQKRLIPAASQQDKDSVAERITQLALRHELVTPYTSLIAVEQQVARASTEDQHSMSRRVPRDALMASMPRTAAGSTQAFALALLALCIAACMCLFSWFSNKEPLSAKGGTYVSQ